MKFLFECCQCGKSYKVAQIHSYTKNRSEEPYICQHFPTVEYRYETKYGFFTWKWQITLKNIYVQCGKCKNWRHFSDKTFKSGITHYDDYEVCCDNVVAFGAHEDDWYYSGSGWEVQKEIDRRKKNEEMKRKLKEERERKEREEKLRKEKEERERKEREEKLRKLKEERERKEREEKLRKEKEEKERKESEEKERREREKMNRMMREQDEETEILNEVINCDLNWIENITAEMNTEADVIVSDNINWSLNEYFEQNYKFKICK